MSERVAMAFCRAASLEQELDSCKEKTLLLTRENHNLQEELSEAYRLKVELITQSIVPVMENYMIFLL